MREWRFETFALRQDDVVALNAPDGHLGLVEFQALRVSALLTYQDREMPVNVSLAEGAPMAELTRTGVSSYGSSNWPSASAEAPAALQSCITRSSRDHAL